MVDDNVFSYIFISEFLKISTEVNGLLLLNRQIALFEKCLFILLSKYIPLLYILTSNTSGRVFSLFIILKKILNIVIAICGAYCDNIVKS